MSAGQRKAGILLNYINEGVKVLTALLYTPLLLRLLGQREYGLYQLAVSVVSWLGLMNLGFGSGYGRYFARYQVAKDEKGISRLNGMFLLIFGTLSALCLVCGGLLAGHTQQIFGTGLTAKELEKAAFLLRILTVNLALTLLNTTFACFLTAKECFLFQKLLRLAQTMLSPFLTLPLLMLGRASEAVAAVSLLLTGAALVGNILWCRRENMQLSFRNLQFSQLQELWQFTFFIFLNQIIDQVNWSADKFLLGRMNGTEAVAVYGIGAQINTMYLQMSTAISTVFLPKVNRLAAQSEDNRTLSELMTRVGVFQAAVLGLVLSDFVLFGREFLLLWAGRNYGKAYPVALLLMIPVTIPLMQNLGIEIQRARGKHRIRSLVYVCLAAGNILLSIAWIPRWGVIGAAAGTAVSLLLGNVLFMNWYYHRHLNLDMGLFWRSISRLVPVWAAALLTGVLLRSVLPITDWCSLAIAVVLYTGIYTLFLATAKKKKGQAEACPQRKIMQ